MADINPRLDDLYRMVAFIYGDKNLARTSTATFAHFVEVCGMLTIHDRQKRREGIDVTSALCKALGWYFPLLSKMKVKSVEELVFRKFPGVCPYCRSKPHREAECKQVRGTDPTLNHKEVERLFQQNWPRRPATLDDWQRMFQDIYPRQLEEHGRSSIGLLEELGEMAEAVRVFEQHPRYFLGEAADIFSYIMGIANEHSIKVTRDGGTFSFGEEFLKRYPGLCPQCGSRVCACPSVPEATVGRMAKELAIGANEEPFIADLTEFFKQGEAVGHHVLEALGGYTGLLEDIPFDRGDANRALITLCLRVAQAVEIQNKVLADQLRTEAYRMSISAKPAGTKQGNLDVAGLLTSLEQAWKSLDEDLRSSLKGERGLLGEISDILDTMRVLFVFCTPADQKALQVGNELRAIKEAVNQQGSSTRVTLETLPAATANDLRRELLKRSYNIIHFAGHADADYLVFEDENGKTSEVPLSAISDLLSQQSSVKCVILNACETGQKLSKPICGSTIAMDEELDDHAAIEFSRGFYDALSAGKTIDEAYREGITAVKLRNLDSDYIRLIK